MIRTSRVPRRNSSLALSTASPCESRGESHTCRPLGKAPFVFLKQPPPGFLCGANGILHIVRGVFLGRSRRDQRMVSHYLQAMAWKGHRKCSKLLGRGAGGEFPEDCEEF